MPRKPKPPKSNRGRKQINQTWTLKELRKHVRSRAASANKVLEKVRAEHPEFLWERWDSVLSEVGTKEGKFRLTSSNLNVHTAEEKLGYLENFLTDIQEQYDDLELYTREVGGYDKASFLAMIEKELRREYFKYFPPSEGEMQEFVGTTMNSVQAMLTDDEYMLDHNFNDIRNRIKEGLKRTGNIADPKQGNTEAFRNWFSVYEYRDINGDLRRKRWL